MISGEKIGKYIQQPSLVEAGDLMDLKELQATYPYCSSLYILYLKGLAVTNDLNFEAQLGKTTIHVHDRAHLFNLIHSQGENAAAEDAVGVINNGDKHDTLQPVERAKDDAQSTFNVTLKIEADTQVEHQNETTNHFAIEAENPLTNRPSNTEDLLISHDLKADDTDFEEFALEGLEQGILTHAIDSAFIQVERQQNLLKQETAIENEDLVNAETTPLVEENQTSATIIETSKVTEAMDSERMNTIDADNEKLSFVAWLKIKNGDNPTPQKTESLIVSEKNADSKANIDALLEKFIAEQPSISRPVKEFYNPAKNAKQSLEESEDLVTETLAKIYALQKNYPKAITTYEKLSLLNPEKKTFFASRIEKLKEELKKR